MKIILLLLFLTKIPPVPNLLLIQSSNTSQNFDFKLIVKYSDFEFATCSRVIAEDRVFSSLFLREKIR